MTIFTSSMSPSLLLTKLPSELRTLIWELILRIEPNDKDNVDGLVWLTPIPQPRPSVLFLLLVCRQIHREAEGIFYQINKLAVDTGTLFLKDWEPRPRAPRRRTESYATDDTSLAHFLNSLSPFRLSCLHSLAIWIVWRSEYRGQRWCCAYQAIVKQCKHLRPVRNLRSVVFYCRQDPCTECFHTDKAATTELRQLRQMEELKVCRAPDPSSQHSWGWRPRAPERFPRKCIVVEHCGNMLQGFLPSSIKKSDKSINHDCRNGKNNIISGQ